MPDIGHQHVWTRTETFGVNAAASRGGVDVTAGISNAKGSYASVIDSTAFDYAGIILHIGQNNVSARFAVDIAIGAAAAEQIVLPDYLFPDNTGGTARLVRLPMAIPAGTKISAAAQSSATSGSPVIRVGGVGIGPNPRLPSPQVARAIAYGYSSAATAGTTVDPGGTAHTKGVWTEITASTTANHHGLLIAPTTYNNGGAVSGITLTANTQWLIDIGVGGSGSEVAIASNLDYHVLSSRYTMQQPSEVMIPIPSGTRLSVRCQCNVNTASERLVDIVLYGLV